VAKLGQNLRLRKNVPVIQINKMSLRPPQRIVCLSAEAADWLWRIGAWKQVAGVTAFFKQPPRVLSKPRVSGFSSANLKQIALLNPDLIITFSDVQAQLAAELIRRGFPVVATNQRTLAEIESTLAMLARIVHRERQGEKLLNEFRKRLAPAKNTLRRPRVYFEEWNEPLISGIAWVSELIERAGGDDIFARLRSQRASSARVVSPEQVCRANPEIVLASWCGKPVQAEQIAARPGWNKVAAVREQRIYEIAGDDILQPGFRLMYGYEQMKKLFRRGL
jgi:iron complex transport system substrate-binding protein